ncbi:winged helix-turn-helix domain-containing protein [Paenibacillus sp. GSMTC-2017]|uniref:BTAD domain-containing putative transcriptional regulator n=1 Tax=Paenibacillus sp. GSMTC-2017 TaxID=2794350 RepID=UPI0018D62D83|nr:BTAD domain-containing putative transcriptional regulator [Paenibacillus sp. GSMTC-2017]MBH5319379.1 winged helix-turn-helix domain-containing protein [Paenibacillus sp. GSMTC-2017]
MIVATKLHIPNERHGLVAREELLRLLDEGLDAKLTLLFAPSGYGKTTALSEWAKQRGKLVAWVSLGKQDDDWITFWSMVIASIQNRVHGFGLTVSPLLAEGPSASSASTELAMTALLNELSRLTDELVIMFDDYHLVTLPAIQKSMSYLLEYLPNHIHIYLASRNNLSFPTARLLAKGEMRRITIEQLRFRQEEVYDLFRETTELNLSVQQLHILYNQTEGWISGLRLAAIALKRSDNVDESIRRFSGRQQQISDYLLEEVIHDLPEAMRDFLLQTSVLSQMNHALCEAVTGQALGQQQLEQLVQLQLFIIPLDDKHNWYRYHHLLSDFLQSMLARTAPELWVQANIRAAQWLENNGYIVEAVEHYLTGRQYEDVVRLIEAHLYELFGGKNIVVARWVMQVPEDYVASRPLVEIFYLMAMVGIRQFHNIPYRAERLRIRIEAMKDNMAADEWNAIIGDVYYLCGTAAYVKRDLLGTADYFILGDTFAPEQSLFIRGGNNNHYSVEEFDDHLCFINDYRDAELFFMKMLVHWRDRVNHPYATPMYASYAKVLYEWNRLEEAEEWINRIIHADGFAPVPRNRFQIAVAASTILQAKGNLREATALLEQVKQKIDSPDYDIFIRKIEAEQASLAVRQGDMESAHRWLLRCRQSHSDEATLDQSSEQLAFVRVLAACEQFDSALSLAERIYDLMTKENRLRDRIRILILQSMVLYSCNQIEPGLAKLDTALRLAEPQGFIRSFVDEGSAMAELLTTYVRLNEDKGTVSKEQLNYARGLLQAFHGHQALPRMKIQTFGRLRVESEKGVAIKWRTSKSEELMAFLVHHRGKSVSRDSILDALWGEVEADRAGAQFHTTSHYLRKALKQIGFDGIFQHAEGGYRIDNSQWFCDLDEWERLLAVGAQTDDIILHEYAGELVQCYGQGYLAGTSYEWALPTRIRLENEYVAMLLSLHEREKEKGQYHAAAELLGKALAHDPLNEYIHEQLVRVLVLADDRISAIKRYEALRVMLLTEFGLEPKEEVRRLLDFDDQSKPNSRNNE